MDRDFEGSERPYKAYNRNHEIEQKNLKKSYSAYFEQILMMDYIKIDGQPIYVCHFPLLCFPGCDGKTWALHGHTHECEGATGFDIDRLKYRLPGQYDVGVDNNNYAPISFEQLKEKLK